MTSVLLGVITERDTLTDTTCSLEAPCSHGVMSEKRPIIQKCLSQKTSTGLLVGRQILVRLHTLTQIIHTCKHTRQPPWGIFGSTSFSNILDK